MGSKYCHRCDKIRSNGGPIRERRLWTPEEDEKLFAYVNSKGSKDISWPSTLPEHLGLKRSSRSCRLRWLNYLRPGLKRGRFTDKEEKRIIHLQKSYGNKWSKIATYFPGRTDNEIKNFWYTQMRKKHHQETVGTYPITNGIQGVGVNHPLSLNSNDLVMNSVVPLDITTPQISTFDHGKGVLSTISTTADHDDQGFLKYQGFDPYIGLNNSYNQVAILSSSKASSTQIDLGSSSTSTINMGPNTNISVANETYGPEGFDDVLNWEDYFNYDAQIVSVANETYGPEGFDDVPDWDNYSNYDWLWESIKN